MSVSRSATKRGGGGAGCSASASDILAKQCSGSARGGPFQARDHIAHARERYVEVRDEPHAVLPTLGVAEHAFRLAPGSECHGAHRELDVHEQEVRLGRGAAQAANALHAFRERLRAAVVLLQAIEM